ncbi:PREDICTED: LOW QUALITY PROTEIN: uncharacterized protein LOC18591673 [Theobroma cacao]|uniref:LOW QUALITY PROTEIN: uncharacterized protein LOC18591673 n=1 Tax=Theobroma cacao TaxID=3641 RepID=A0AB32WTU8_THECC|nr:PREDICTED: LOW QUALITY PROTEIN: uncharacterized protein LOC18591673 [Theobroma cacao]
MDALIITMKSNFHARSNSLPSKSHPLVADVEDQLRRFRASEATFSSPSVLCQNLSALKDLYECADNLLQLQLAQKAFSNELHDKCVEDMLDGSLRVLDICSLSKDALSQIKGCLQDLESSFRRRTGCESSLANEIRKYFISRKQVSKIVCKCFGNMKRMQKRNAATPENDHDFVAVVSVLKEVEAVSLSVRVSIVICLPPKIKVNWLVLGLKLIQSKRLSCEIEDKEDKIDHTLEALIKNKTSKSIDVTQVQKALKDLEAFDSIIQELEGGLECVFRCLIKTRVSFLNIVNH